MSSLAYERVHEILREFPLETIDSILDACLEHAIKKKKPALEILDYLLVEEQKARQNKQREATLKMSGIPFNKTLDDFDFKFQPIH